MPANNLFELIPGLKLGPQGPGAMQIASDEGLGWANQVQGADGRTYIVAPNNTTGGYDLYPANAQLGKDARIEFGQDGTYKNAYTMQDAPSNAQLFAQWAGTAAAMYFGIPAMQEGAGAGAMSGMDMAADTPGFAGSYAPGAAGGAGAGGATPYTFNAAADSQAAYGAMPGGGVDAGLSGAQDALSTGYGLPAGTGGAGGGGSGALGSVGAANPGGGSAPGGFSVGNAIKAVAPSIIGGYLNNKAANDAAGIQAGAAQAGIDETRRQYDTMRGLLQPYVDAGGRGLNSYEALAGTLGPQAQQAAIAQLQGTPMWGSTVKAGEDAILQNVAATGGLRGGNTQDALAKFRAGLLTDQVNQSLGRYGALANMGQNSAAGVGSAAMNSGQNIAQLLGQQGAANAGGVLAGNRAIVNTIGGVGGIAAANGGFSLPGAMPTASGMQAAASQTPMGSSGFGSGLAYGNQDLGAYF